MKNVCVVTGGGSGIGFATAKEVAKKGYYVIMEKMMKKVKMFPKKTREGVAYSISKHFTIWFAKQDAARFAAKMQEF